MNIERILYWIIGLAVVFGIAAGGWFYFFKIPSSPTVQNTNGFGAGNDRTVTVTPRSTTEENATTPVSNGSVASTKKIFKVTDGPVTTATLIQTYHPTTTIARYVLQENGHVLDLTLDNPGSVARAASNTTIPGSLMGRWAEGGRSVVLQYLEDSTTKSVYIGLPASTTATSSRTQPVRIQFLPDDIRDFGVSPDGKNITYLLQTTTGSDGYTAKADGTSRTKIFSIPFTEALVSWPATGSILLQTKSGQGLNGAVFSVSPQNGAISPLVYGLGITATANTTFGYVVYQSVAAAINSYVHSMKSGRDAGLSFNPMPEKCVWSKIKTSGLYCATPIGYVDPSYIDEWHRGSASAKDALLYFDVATGASTILGIPGGDDGGVDTDVAELAVSPDSHYLLFIKKGDRSLWAMRLTQ
jgi:hypothetical protein